jgi:hypothetical protein
MYNEDAIRRMRLAQAETEDRSNTDVVTHGRTKSTIHGTESERIRLRQFLTDLHSGELSRSLRGRGEIRYV